MIDPDFFGCSGKLSYEETSALVTAAGHAASVGDFSEIATTGRVVTSIDRVHRCAKDWSRFARMALNHVFADVLCAGGTPIQAMLSFDFGIDVTADERAECSTAFLSELASRSVSIGKCHSGYSGGVTAVTIATLATAPEAAPPSPDHGSIHLSRPIGAAKLQYLGEMGIDVPFAAARALLEAPPDQRFHGLGWSLMTDVSGHGLLGAAAQVAAIHGLQIELELSATHALSPEVLAVQVECLQNPLSSYGAALTEGEHRAVVLATLRETAGPFLGLLEDGAQPPAGDDGTPYLPVGRYRRGNPGVVLKWAE